ncbi:hypothetical protein EX30DRAFT_340559 [Ascodesmis nigricans]|uniref:Uncharacterized protein n=1 Tax=Ascodesmis nigricans TaxID=341454 RepID=A0A4S2MYB9_9PEZI|nr:hypothetical protein EX30DRAFT_340559 [Ascodesmis nigricans]
MRTTVWHPSTSIFISGVCILVASLLGRLYFQRYQRFRRLREAHFEESTLPLSIAIKPIRPVGMFLPPSHDADDLDIPPRGNPWLDELHSPRNGLHSSEPQSGEAQPEDQEPIHLHNLISHLPAPSNFPPPCATSDEIIRYEHKVYLQGTHIKSVLEEQAPHTGWRRRMIVYANGGGGPELRGWGGRQRRRSGAQGMVGDGNAEGNDC